MAFKKRPLPRAARAALDHDLPPHKPEVGDIVMAFHLFNEFDDAVDTMKKRENGEVSSLKTRKEEIAKFRPCLVVYAKGNEAFLVPVSSRRDQQGRHLEINEPSELKELGLAPHKPSYARTLGMAKYDFEDNPLILPTIGDDGKPTWLIGKAPRELVGQVLQDVSRQKKHGRMKKLPTRFAKDVPQEVTDEMRRLAEEAKAQNAPRRAIPRRPEAPANQASDKEMQRRLNALRLHQVQEKAAARKMRDDAPPDQAKPDRGQQI